MAVKATWYGHANWMIEANGKKVLIDPFFTGNPKAPIGADQVEADFILVSHAHGDHVGDTTAISKRTGATAICNYEISLYLEKQGCKVHPMHIGGARDFPFGRVKLTIAHHGSMFPDGSNGGNPVGFLVTVGGKKIYHAADTGLFYDMKLIGDEKVDLALLPIGDNFTMGPEDAVRAIELIRPAAVVPMHYDTFDLIRQDAQAFASRVHQAVPGTKVTVLKPGESLDLG